MNKPQQRQKLVMQVSIQTIVINLILTVFKFFAGVVSHSGAMISDAVHSASDVLSTLVVMAGVRLSGKDSDDDHPYGHERLESVAAILLAVALGVTGLGIGWSGVGKIRGDAATLAVPGLLALVAAVVSIAVKEAMYWYTRAAAKKTGSSALMADAWHHRSDALSSVGSFAGIFGARMGLVVLEPIASVVICVFIVAAAVGIFRDAVSKLTDRACPAEMQQNLRDIVLRQDGVMGLDRLRTRCFGDRIYIDIDICADAEASLSQAHAVAQQVHDEIEAAFPAVKHCMVHVNPASKACFQPTE